MGPTSDSVGGSSDPASVSRASLARQASEDSGGSSAFGAEFPVSVVRPAYEQVANQLRDLMVSGELVPGQRLPSEAELASLFGVGRTTIREGLRLLAAQQLLVTTRGVKGGTFVVTPDADNISLYLETSIGLLAGTDRMSIQELLEARHYLEVPATVLATNRCSEQQLMAVEATVQPSSSVRMEHSNFHTAILQASGNRMLGVMARPIFDVMRMRLDRAAAPPRFWDMVNSDHLEIYRAMASRDSSHASQAMAEHLDRLAAVYEAIDVAPHDT